jgi:hypothetical protein
VLAAQYESFRLPFAVILMYRWRFSPRCSDCGSRAARTTCLRRSA